ncbi:MAG: glycosyltransferase family 39 protein, partial [Acidobacteria bacterium]|nr:glycosyltransferase family 39 protein [Acidobacteriota bacterium]
MSRTRERSTSSVALKSAQPLLVPLLLLLHLLLTLSLAYKLNIWVDEAFSLGTTERGVGYGLRQALNFELQAPLYFLLLSLWRKINSSIFFARLFSVACVGLAIQVTAQLARRFFRDVHPAWFVAAVAFNPLVIIVAVDVRLYALVLLLTALLLLAFHDGYLSETPSRRAQVCYVVLALAALYTQYYMGFLLVANACALCALKRWRALVEYLVGMVAVGLCFAPMLPFIRYQMSAHTAPMQNRETWFEGFKFVTWRMKDYVLPPGWDFSLVVRSWILRLCYLGTLVLLGYRFALYLLHKKRHILTPEFIALWTITLVVTLFFLFTARLSGEMLLQIRHTIVLFLPVNLAVFALVRLAENRRVLYVWVCLVLLFSLTALFEHYRPLAKYGDWQRVAAYLMSEEQPGQAILVFHAGAALPLERYYAGRNALVPLPRENTFERFDFHDYVLRDEREITAALERAPGDDETI